MRALLLTAFAGLMAASTALAAPPGPKDTATVCLDPMGVGYPAQCKTVGASRFPTQPDICMCRGPMRQVDAPWCDRGETPAPDSAEMNRARIAYARRNHNSLVGFTFEGKRACVPQGNGSLP